MDNVTFLIKTFEREYCIKKLVKSIYKYYPDAIVVIGDDSNVSCKKYFEKKYSKKRLSVYELPRDCGLSYGRNFLLDRVETEYFLLLDDDFEFDKKTDVKAALEELERNDLDIIGGYLRDYGNIHSNFDKVKMAVKDIIDKKRDYNYIGKLNLDENEKTLYADYITNEFPDFTMTDIVLNFFIGNTERIRSVNRWDDDLKLCEHTAFFLNAKKNGIRVGFTNKMSIKHKPFRNKDYNAYRNRNYSIIFFTKIDINKRVVTRNGGKPSITEVPEDIKAKVREMLENEHADINGAGACND